MFLSIGKIRDETRILKQGIQNEIPIQLYYIFVQPQTNYKNSGPKCSIVKWEWQQENQKLTSEQKFKATISRPTTSVIKGEETLSSSSSNTPLTILTCLDNYCILSFILAMVSHHRAFPKTVIPLKLTTYNSLSPSPPSGLKPCPMPSEIHQHLQIHC